MNFVLGKAVIKSSLCAITSINIQFAVSIQNGVLCFCLRKEHSSSILHIHYHRISYIAISEKIISTYE